MNDQEKREFQELKRMVEDLRFQLSRKTGLSSADIRGNVISSSVQAGGLASGAINNSNMFSAGIVDQAAIGANAVGQSELSDEEATLVFGAADTSQTASVTSGSDVYSFYVSDFTGTPAQGELKLAVSGTTLTGTRSAAPGGGNAVTYKVKLLKV